MEAQSRTVRIYIYAGMCASMVVSDK